MGLERDAQYYDRGYSTNPRYKLSADEAPWTRLWYWIMSRTRREMLIDFGCGSGHLAEILERSGHPPHMYLGVDFSQEALRQARQRVPSYRFVCDTLPDAVGRILSTPGATAIFCEVLEHFKLDKAALKRLPTGTRILATVPQKDSKTHVRHFQTMNEVCRRYEGFVEIQTLEHINSAYAFEATRREKKSVVAKAAQVAGE